MVPSADSRVSAGVETGSRGKCIRSEGCGHRAFEPHEDNDSLMLGKAPSLSFGTGLYSDCTCVRHSV